MQLKTKTGTRKILSGTDPKVANDSGKEVGKADGNLNLL
jgi:hypothetical protein